MIINYLNSVLINYIKIFIGNNYDITTRKFINNYDKEFCKNQYEKYQKMRKTKEIYITPSLTCPPKK